MKKQVFLDFFKKISIFYNIIDSFFYTLQKFLIFIDFIDFNLPILRL